MSKAYVEARSQHGESELLDEIVAAKPHVDHTRYHSYEELKEHGLAHLRNAAALLESKATPQERDDYQRFVLTLAGKVAAAADTILRQPLGPAACERGAGNEAWNREQDAERNEDADQPDFPAGKFEHQSFAGLALGLSTWLIVDLTTRIRTP